METREFIVKANKKHVRFFGRVSNKVIEGVTFFNWSESGFEFRFTGTDAYAEFITDLRDGVNIADEKSCAYIGVFVDNSPYQISRFPLDKRKKVYTLVKGLPFGVHTVRVVKQSEVGYGRAAVGYLKTVGIEPPTPTAPKKLLFEFIGDSNTCGYGNICSNMSPDFLTSEENSSLSYAALLAQKFDADISCICASGNGIAHDYGCSTHNQMPALYPYTDKMLFEHFGIPAEKWNITDRIPDLITIKLGENDARYCEGADVEPELRTADLKAKRKKEFGESLYHFLNQIISSRPGAPICYLYESDMVLKSAITETIERYKNDNPCIRLIGIEIIPKRVDWEGAGANGHWSVYTHNRVAAVLEPVFKELLKGAANEAAG